MYIYPKEVTIAASSDKTEEINLKAQKLAGIVVPSDWTSANIYFEQSFEGGDDAEWHTVYDEYGEMVAFTPELGSYRALALSVFAGIKYLRVCSGTPSSAVNQAAERTIILSVREY